MTGKHYLYRHLIPGGGPFYVGIGTKPKKIFASTEYSRAHDKVGRNDLWQRVANKYGFEVEILYETDSYDEVKQKEKEFIKLYGRRNLNNGILVNFTDGGDGNTGYVCSPESKAKMSKSNRRFQPADVRKKISETLKKFYSENDHPPVTEETRNKMSLKKKGKVGNRLGISPSEVTRQKLRLANIGKKHSEETKEKVRIASTGRKRSPESIAKQIANTKKVSRKHTEESKRKIGLASRGNKNRLGHKNTEAQKLKISIANTGKKMSESAKLKISLAAKGRVVIPKGSKLSDKHKANLKIAWQKRKGLLNLFD